MLIFLQKNADFNKLKGVLLRKGKYGRVLSYQFSNFWHNSNGFKTEGNFSTFPLPSTAKSKPKGPT